MSLSLRSRFWRFVLRKTFKEQRLTIEQNRARDAKTARLMRYVPKDMEVERTDMDGLPRCMDSSDRRGQGERSSCFCMAADMSPVR